MNKVARKGDTVLGMTSGEHAGHNPGHGPCTLTGTIDNGDNTVLVNGKPIAYRGCTTSENDCCNPGSGSLTSGSSSVFVNGNRVARFGDPITPHNGSASINKGDDGVFCS